MNRAIFIILSVALLTGLYAQRQMNRHEVVAIVEPTAGTAANLQGKLAHMLGEDNVNLAKPPMPRTAEEPNAAVLISVPTRNPDKAVAAVEEALQIIINAIADEQVHERVRMQAEVAALEAYLENTNKIFAGFVWRDPVRILKAQERLAGLRQSLALQKPIRIVLAPAVRGSSVNLRKLAAMPIVFLILALIPFWLWDNCDRLSRMWKLENWSEGKE